jgi:hypothetical protein
MPQRQQPSKDLKEEYRRKNTFWHRWASLIILIVLFFGSWTGQFFNQMQVVKLDAAEHHQTFAMSDFWPHFWESTFENWQSEWLQLFTQGLIIAGFASYMFRKGEEETYKTHLMI